ncbi:cell division protein FtsK, partial [Streptomyces sp. NPDC059627]
MRLSLTVVDPVGGATADVVLDADPESTVGDVARELARQVGVGYPEIQGGAQVIPIGAPRGAAPFQATGPHAYVDGYALDPAATVVGSPLRDGVVVSLHDPAGCLLGEPTGVVEFRVAGGPAAGAVHRLGVGRYDIGTGAASHLRVEDPELPARAATLTIAIDGTCKVQTHVDDVRLDGEELKGDGDWPLNSQLALGNTLLEITGYAPPNAALKWSDDGAGLDYNRPPRLRPADRQTHFSLPNPPGDYEARPLPWLMAVLPLVGAVVSVFMFHRWYYLIMAVMSPLMLFGNYFMDKKHGRKSHAKQLKEYKEHKARIDGEAQEALVAERTERRGAVPDPAAVLTYGTGPRTRLWERRRTDADHLLIRFGTGRVPSEVELDDPEQDEHKRKVRWYIEDAPVGLSLRDLGVIGVAGPGDSAHALGRWAVAQTAVLHSPMDVQFYVLTDNDAGTRWDWVRWLPHSRPAGGQDVNVLIGTDSPARGPPRGGRTPPPPRPPKSPPHGGRPRSTG